MGIFSKIFGTRCAFCKQKTSEPRKYLNRQGIPVQLCPKCSVQAERMALKKL